MRRKIEQLFLQWKQNPDRKPLVVKGCRQCGKTYSVLSFARANYEHVIYLNFHEQPSYKKFFQGALAAYQADADWGKFNIQAIP